MTTKPGIPYRVLDHGYVRLIEAWGSDERIIESARMSTAKGFQGWGPKEDGSPGDEKLLRYLWENKHSTPFEMAGLTIEVQAPIFVFREWHRHRVPFGYSEQSARYVEMEELFYVPDVGRLLFGGQSKSNKQASGEPIDPSDVEQIQADIRGQCASAFNSYQILLDTGVAREIARVVLPVNTYSRMRATGNLRGWLAFLGLRMAPGAQWEIRQYANVVSDLVRDAFPRTHALFSEGVR